MINVSNLIHQSRPELVERWPRLSRLIIRFLQWAIREDKFHTFKQRYPDAQGVEFTDKVMEYAGFTYQADKAALQHIPAYGGLVIVANHPIGSLDGLALISMVAKVRSDVKILANEMLSQLGPLAQVMIPIKVWGSSQREQLETAIQHLRNGASLIIFPSGKVSRFGREGIKDGKWQSGFLKLAKVNRTPILPIHVQARNSLFFYLISLLAPPISTLWLVRELFKQKGHSATFTIGNPVSFSSYTAEALPTADVCARFKAQTYALKEGLSGPFPTDEPIAPAEDRRQLRAEIKACTFLGNTPDNMSVYLYRYQGNCSIIRELGRLRELAFRSGSEGTGKARDLDTFDEHYHQLILWDDKAVEMVGAYRLREGIDGIDSATDHLYSTKLFNLEPAFNNFRKQGVELGRSFVQPKYWNRRSLDYLWYALGAFLRENPHIRYLFGPVTLPATYPATARELLVHFYSRHFPARENLVTAQSPCLISAEKEAELNSLLPGEDYKQDFVELKKQYAKLGMSIPTLFKQYTEACEDGGVQLPAFHNGSGIGGGITGFIIVDLSKMKANKRSRYIEPTTISA